MTKSGRLRAGVFAALIGGVLVCSASVRAQETPPAQPPEPAIGVESDGRSDAAIADRIRAIFREIEAFGDITATVRAGVVTLDGTVLERDRAAEAVALANRVEGVVAVRDETELDASVEDRLDPAFDRLNTRLRAGVDLLPLLAVAILAFAVLVTLGLLLARWRGPWERLAPNSFVADLIRQIVRLAFIAGGLVVALDILGATALLGTILGAAGIAGLAIGFAVRDTIENYIASIMLSIRQPFRPNDHVLIEGHEGHVLSLTSRATVIMTLDGNHVRIPNATVFKGILVNFTRNPDRRFEFRLGVDGDGNLKQALELALDTLRGLDFVLDDPEPLAWIDEVGDSNVVLWVGGWIDQRKTDYAKARSEAIRLTKRALEEAGIGIPEPIYRLRVDQGSVRAMVPGEASGAPPPPEPAGSVESAEIGDASAETAVVEKVAAERISGRGEDLLDPTAPTE
ncbi:MAG: mechanosensitive ion channel domain-containing protein [Inquilinaceae bacterium]